MGKSYVYPMFIIGTLFFVFGFLTWINGILIPYFQICLELSNFQSTWVAFSSYVAYFVMAIPSAWILKSTGYRKGMFLGLIVMALGTALFIPAAITRTYSLFLIGLFVTGTGLALLQTAANPYVAIIGPIESHAQRIGFMGLANKIAGLLSLAIFGSVFLFNADDIIKQVEVASIVEKEQILDSYALKIVNPYIIVTLILLLLSVVIYFSKLPEVKDETENQAEEGIESKSGILKYPYLLLGVFALFCAGACEVIPIDGIILYSKSLGISINESRYFAQYTLYAMIVGYIVSVLFIPKYLSQQKALLLSALWGMFFTIVAYFSSGIISVGCVILMGFSASLFWGTIWGLSLKGLGKYTKLGSAMLLMSVVGGGIFPVIFGRLIDINVDYPQTSILLLLPCYAFILFFALRGHKVIKWSGFNK
ncbi:sugar MFS transporter [Pseudopedobacter beijingensis]|uniref:Sugar MFS transporter n=1 Tax=Pseudopedobacter beijingensis TaxID=1207056 RepID=A0ABW4IH73_9SPHI